MGFALKISQKGLLLVALPSILELVFVLTLAGLLGQAEREAALEARSKAVIACANSLTRATVDATTAAGAFKITANQLFAQRAELALESVKVQHDKLKVLLKDNPKRLKDLKSVEKLTEELIKVIAILKAPAEDSEIPSLHSLIGRGRQFTAINRLVNQLGVTTNLLIADELKIELESPMQKARTREQIKRVLFGGVALSILLAFALAWYFSRSVTRRLLIVRENTGRLAKRQKLVEPIGGLDEISDLDSAFHAAAGRLEELESFKKQLIGIVSHELKTPLSSMQVNLALMENGASGELPEKAKAKVLVLENNVNRLIRLINDLLDIEKMESGRFELSREDHEIAKLLQNSMDLVREFAAKKNVDIVVPETKLFVNADLDRAVQVLVNLLSNAVKYSAENSQVIIELKEQESFIEISVIDRGRGIPASHLEKVFDRFQQVEKADEKEKGGTGLGLAICKAIVEEHGGQIGVESRLSEGSRFWFRLPKAKAAIQ